MSSTTAAPTTTFRESIRPHLRPLVEVVDTFESKHQITHWEAQSIATTAVTAFDRIRKAWRAPDTPRSVAYEYEYEEALAFCSAVACLAYHVVDGGVEGNFDHPTPEDAFQDLHVFARLIRQRWMDGE